MPGLNQYKTFAASSGNSHTPAEWAALTTLLSGGFVAGTAKSIEFNTLMRQLSVPMTALATIIADSGLDALDNGDPNDFKTKFLAAISGASAGNSVAAASSSLVLSTSGASGDINISADELVVKSSANNYKTLQGVSLTGSIADLDVGTLATNTWYAVYVIWNLTTAVIDTLISASATTPTMPAGFTHKARVGWIKTDSTSNKYPLSILQKGNSVQYVVGAAGNTTAFPLMLSGTTAGQVPVAVSPFVPTTAKTIKTSYKYESGGGGGIQLLTNAQAASMVFEYTTGLAGGWYGAMEQEVLLESSNIYAQAFQSGGGGSTHELSCLGWEN